MSEFIKEETIDEIVAIVAATDGYEFAELYGVITGAPVSVEDAHYRHDELLEEIEVELSNLNEEELATLADFIENRDSENIEDY